MYQHYDISNEAYADFDVTITHQRKWYKPQAMFYFDDFAPFLPLPANQDFAMLEWGLNWCYANHANDLLSFHAAVLARNNQAVIFPGFPGAGKSTLTAELMFNHWQLLSDEMTLINEESMILPSPRPVSLKNQSIEIIRNRYPDAVLTESAFDTAKGTVAHLMPKVEEIDAASCAVHACAVVFPEYKANSELITQELDKAETLVFLAEQGFNYHILGEEGYRRLSTIIENCACYSLVYSELDSATGWLNTLVESSQ